MSAQPTPLPWHEPALAELANRFDANRLAHALLLAGRRLTGKTTFARLLAARVLCREASTGGRNAACGTCSECQLIAAGTHPDLLEITPVDSKQIKVEQIRRLLGWMRGTPQRGGYRVVVLWPAHAMNGISANALLKGLEEPGRDSLLILVTDQPGALLPTVRSRCQRLNLPLASQQEGLTWLGHAVPAGALPVGTDQATLMQIADGNPVEVAVRSGDGFYERRDAVFGLLREGAAGAPPLAVAAQLARMDGLEVIELWSGLLLDVAKVAAGAVSHCRNVDQRESLEVLGDRADPGALADFSDELIRAQQSLLGPSNPNLQLRFEHLCRAWATL